MPITFQVTGNMPEDPVAKYLSIVESLTKHLRAAPPGLISVILNGRRVPADFDNTTIYELQFPIILLQLCILTQVTQTPQFSLSKKKHQLARIQDDLKLAVTQRVDWGCLVFSLRTVGVNINNILEQLQFGNALNSNADVFGTSPDEKYRNFNTFKSVLQECINSITVYSTTNRLPPVGVHADEIARVNSAVNRLKMKFEIISECLGGPQVAQRTAVRRRGLFDVVGKKNAASVVLLLLAYGLKNKEQSGLAMLLIVGILLLNFKSIVESATQRMNPHQRRP